MMFSSLFKNLQQPPARIDYEAVCQQIFELIRSNIETAIGEQVDLPNQFLTQTASLKALQHQIIEIKEKYNDTIQRFSVTVQALKRLSTVFIDFITCINLYIQSEDMLIPLKEIQKGINELAVDRVEKHMNYLVKLFEIAYSEAVEAKTQEALHSIQGELKCVNNMNRGLEEQLAAFKQAKSSADNKQTEVSVRVQELAIKLAEATEKNNKIQKDKQQLIRKLSALQKSFNDIKQKQKQLRDKLKVQESEKSLIQRQLIEKERDLARSAALSSNSRNAEDEIITQLRQQFTRKQRLYEGQASRLLVEKDTMRLELIASKERCEELGKEVLKLKDQKELWEQERAEWEAKDQEENIRRSRTLEEGHSKYHGTPEEEQNQDDDASHNDGNTANEVPNVENRLSSTGQFASNLSASKISARSNPHMLNSSIGSHQDDSVVNRVVMRDLFLKYDSQNIEWSMKKTIKGQIETLLEVKKIEPKPEDDNKKKGWFGLF